MSGPFARALSSRQRFTPRVTSAKQRNLPGKVCPPSRATPIVGASTIDHPATSLGPRCAIATRE